jgi:hypothetical protein
MRIQHGEEGRGTPDTDKVMRLKVFGSDEAKGNWCFAGVVEDQRHCFWHTMSEVQVSPGKYSIGNDR